MQSATHTCNDALPLRHKGRGEAFALLAVPLAALALTGCVGLRTPGEKVAHREFNQIEAQFRPEGSKPALPTLTTNSPLRDFLQFAILNQPQVEAAYFDWAASVRRITVERSLPDPRLTFEADIADVVMTLMPGVMFDFPGPGKLRAAADVAAAESQATYYKLARVVLQSAFNLKRAYYQLHFLEQRISVNRQTLDLLGILEKLARTQNEVGKATLQDVLRSQIEQERLRTEIANLEDSRNPLLAQFKGALGLDISAPNPPIPVRIESTPLDVSQPDFFQRVLTNSPRVRVMEAEIRMADAAIRVAQRGRIPDFSLGVEADIKPSPWMWRPQASVTLPIWRDKIAAQIAAAQASRRAAQARLSAEQIMLAIDFAERVFMVRESERNLSLLRERLLPRAGESLQVARAAYAAGRVDFINLIDAERTLLEFQLAEVQAQTQRELALAELSLLLLAELPPGAPTIRNAHDR